MLVTGKLLNKYCTKCSSDGPFPVDRSSPNGLHSQCKRCHADRIATRRAANPAKARAETRKSCRLWRKRHPEKQKALTNEWLVINRHTPEFKAKTKATRLRYETKHPEAVRLRRLARRAREANANGRCSAQQLRDRIAFFGGLCAYCKAPHEHVDHSISLKNHGTNWPANLRPACADCNLRKGVNTWKQVLL